MEANLQFDTEAWDQIISSFTVYLSTIRVRD